MMKLNSAASDLGLASDPGLTNVCFASHLYNHAGNLA